MSNIIADALNILPGIAILDGARRITSEETGILDKVVGAVELMLGIGLYELGGDE